MVVMRFLSVRLLGVLALAFAALISPSVAQAEVKALLVASNYDKAQDEQLRLANPIADLRLIRSSLRSTNVRDLTVLEEPTAQDWQEGFDAWLDTLSGDDIGLFYYAGHGFQFDGLNYLLSSDGVSLIPLDALVGQITARARGAVIIIDACRNNPFFNAEPEAALDIIEIDGTTRSLSFIRLEDMSGAGDGLAQLGNLRGLSAVAFFSTEPGNVAEDGDQPGKGSPFAIEFAKQIDRRQSLDEVFRKTAIAVNKRTDERQSPWRQGDLAFDVFISGMRALPIP
ncbi:hypothetical protein EH31_02450 [Erythrobacter longus]|uniref:Peptidase C14 caspase domain-containing protein n=2 Tax=Erythrobacter longus TaxID=1044 RepID=A0A074MI56_ERYLO|nr:hypothetical protein EH31_02450 [Erythrobacter longus]